MDPLSPSLCGSIDSQRLTGRPVPVTNPLYLVKFALTGQVPGSMGHTVGIPQSKRIRAERE